MIGSTALGSTAAGQLRLLRWSLGWAVVFAIASGCGTPKCRPVRSLAEVREDVADQIEDRLDDLDATDAQHKRIQAIGARGMQGVPELRKQVLPRTRKLIRELRAPKPDRAKLTELVKQTGAIYAAYIKNLTPLIIEANQVLTPEQRKLASREYEKDADEAQDSWGTNLAIQYFLTKLDATDSQRAVFKRIRADLDKKLDAYRKHMQNVNKRLANEFRSGKPSAKAIDAAVDHGAAHTQALVFEIIGYYLYFTERLEPDQRKWLSRQLLRFSPCPGA